MPSIVWKAGVLLWQVESALSAAPVPCTPSTVQRRGLSVRVFLSLSLHLHRLVESAKPGGEEIRRLDQEFPNRRPVPRQGTGSGLPGFPFGAVRVEAPCSGNWRSALVLCALNGSAMKRSS